MIVCRRLVCLLLSALASAGAAEREVTRKFAVQPGCMLVVESDRGPITIEESDAAEVAVTIHMEAGVDSEPEAERIFGALQLEMKLENNTVTIRARNPSETRMRWFWEEHKRIELSYKFTVPRQCSVQLTLATGNITVGNLAGRHTARVEAGNIFFKRIDGSVDVHADTGGVIVSRCSGAVAVRLRQGTVRLGTIGGRVDVRNGSGDIDVLQAKGGIMAVAMAGDVSVGFRDEFGADNRVTASGGRIIAKIDAKANCTVQASASLWGRVECTLPLTIESGALGKRKVVARLNAGGPLITLDASGGVKIAPLDFEID